MKDDAVAGHSVHHPDLAAISPDRQHRQIVHRGDDASAELRRGRAHGGDQSQPARCSRLPEIPVVAPIAPMSVGGHSVLASLADRGARPGHCKPSLWSKPNAGTKLPTFSIQRLLQPINAFARCADQLEPLNLQRH